MSMLKSHSLTLTLSSHSLTLSLTHLLTLEMMNNFCFHVFAFLSLFIDENVNAFFDSTIITLSCYFRCHRAGFQLKILDQVTFNHPHSLCLSRVALHCTDVDDNLDVVFVMLSSGLCSTQLLCLLYYDIFCYLINLGSTWPDENFGVNFTLYRFL